MIFLIFLLFTISNSPYLPVAAKHAKRDAADCIAGCILFAIFYYRR